MKCTEDIETCRATVYRDDGNWPDGTDLRRRWFHRSDADLRRLFVIRYTYEADLDFSSLRRRVISELLEEYPDCIVVA